MEINFIEEVSKALDVLSVERLVRTRPSGSVRCGPCGKKLYTYTQARFVVLRIRQNEMGYTGEYSCPAQEGDLYHVTNIDKQLKKARQKYPNEVRRLERYKIYLDRATSRTFGTGAQHNLVVVDGRTGPHLYPKALRLRIARALVFPLQGLRKPRPHLIRRGYKPFKRTPRRDTARRDYPRGETMTRMLSWANSEKFHVSKTGCTRGCGCRQPRGDGAEFRRRNRARETEAVRQEIDRERGMI